MVECTGPIQGRRRIFWTTQPDSCGGVVSCAAECGIPGLALYTPESDPKARTFRNDDWIRGLALNMLGTDGRKDDTLCGHRPGARGGHWSDIFRGDGKSSGTQLRYVSKQTSVVDTVQVIQAHMQMTLQRMVDYGVASAVTVKVTYAGRNVYNANIEIIGTNGHTSRVGVVGNRLENSWVWDTTT
jgi:phage gp46-like protein